ncbi:serine protease Do [Evansella caseinilytica]|uniref:Serine protease Do n=1 Tax=Evansella caseinilytica TaxID=1503961 RepID=A0A1H3UPS9_9BACI|nr:trypsin-like peptidase domain-containing protein [Evansella caseinilytica]SDZ64443.1 serine protease Do [Evansella caseinilytica]
MHIENGNDVNEVKQDDKRQTKKRSKAGRFFSMMAAGMAGSILTLSIYHYTPLNQNENIYAVNSEDDNVIAEDIDSENNSLVQTSYSTDSLADIVENASKAIVGIVNIQEQQNFHQTSTVESGTGSGVVFRQDDTGTYIVTNHHVIEGAAEIEVSLENGEKTTAELIGSDALTDIAVLRISNEYETSVIEFGDSSTLRPGDQVLAIGNPLGLDLSRTVTQGIVSAVDRTISVTTSAGEWELDVIQTDAAINPGNSGGALINTAGQVIGINSLKISEDGVEGLGFAIPSNEFIPVIEEIISQGKITRPYLGVGLAGLEEIPHFYLEQLNADLDSGVMITSIDPDSAAAQAGLQVEDIILSINGTEMQSASDVRKYLYNESGIGEEINIEIYRQGETRTVNVTLMSNGSM